MLYYLGISVDLTLTGLVGYRLTPVPALATLPFALISLGSWVATYPASRFMDRCGRKRGFFTGSAAAVVGGLASVAALYTRQFALFCLGVGLIGVYQAFAGYYRYAAADLFPDRRRGRAISAVLSSGVVAAVVGPFLATSVKDTLPVEFAGSYALVTVLAMVSAGVLALLPEAQAAPRESAGDTAAVPAEDPPRPLARIVRQPAFVTGVFGSCIGYLVMMLLMTAAPIAAVRAGHTVRQGARVVQWHMVGMYATAFVSGPLTRRIGPTWTLLGGTTVTAAGAVIGWTEMSQAAFAVGLGLVGIGWNLMYVAGSALVAASYRPNERAAVQGLGEVFTLGGSAAGALAAGPLLKATAWHTMTVATLGPLTASALITIACLWHRARHTR